MFNPKLQRNVVTSSDSLGLCKDCVYTIPVPAENIILHLIAFFGQQNG